MTRFTRMLGLELNRQLVEKHGDGKVYHWQLAADSAKMDAMLEWEKSGHCCVVGVITSRRWT